MKQPFYKRLVGGAAWFATGALCLCAAYASPLTGDTSNMGLWIAMVVVALIAVVVLLIVGRKKKK